MTWWDMRMGGTFLYLMHHVGLFWLWIWWERSSNSRLQGEIWKRLYSLWDRTTKPRYSGKQGRKSRDTHESICIPVLLNMGKNSSQTLWQLLTLGSDKALDSACLAWVLLWSLTPYNMKADKPAQHSPDLNQKGNAVAQNYKLHLKIAIFNLKTKTIRYLALIWNM